MARLDELRGEAIREALRDCLSGVEAMPSRRDAVLAAVRGNRDASGRKLSVAFAVALALTLLAAAAAAAAWLGTRELVEREAIPLALQNDGAQVNETFTSEELSHIVAVAQENGVAVPQSLMEKLEAGEGYWEEETIMALAKAEFGPMPGRWTLEQQYWFEEAAVAIGFKDVNVKRVPGEGDLTYEQALAIAENALAERFGVDAAALGDETRYAVTRSYCENEPGAFTWHFWFEPLVFEADEYVIELDRAGNVTEIGGDAASQTPRGCEYILSFYEGAYGTPYDWDTALWVEFSQRIREAPDLETQVFAQGFARTDYLNESDLPQGALSRAEAEAVALGAASGTGVDCAVLYDAEPNPVWKVTVRCAGADGETDEQRMIEVDAQTGEVRSQTVRTDDMNWHRLLVCEEAARQIEAEHPKHPEGLG